MSQFDLDGFTIGNHNPCYIIAEIGINHNGDIGIAKKLIDAAVEAGANAVKFQKRNLNEIYQKNIIDDPSLDSQGTEILIGILKEVEFEEVEFEELFSYCKNKKITFLCTPWDKTSVDFLDRFNLPAYKISSADMTNFPLIKYISQKKKPIIISSGMSTMEEIESTIEFIKNEDIPFVLLHCNSTYPSPVELLNIELIPLLREKFKVLVGYSGHEMGIIPTVTATNLGAVIVERHITLDKNMEGLDQSASLEPNEFKKMVEFIRESEKSKGVPIKKMTRGEVLQREILSKSIACSSEIKKGEIFSEHNLEIKTPARGISPQFYYKLLGKKANRDFKIGEFLQMNDLQ